MIESSDGRGFLDSAALFTRFARFVASFLYRQGARSGDLEDLVQEVFLAAHRKGGYRPGAASPTTFLAQLALEQHLARKRSDGRHQARASREAAASLLGRTPCDPAQAFSEKEDVHRLESALALMDEEPRAVFILFELEGEACEAIAAGLGVPLGTVHSRLHYARKVFQAHLARRALREAAPLQRSERRALPRWAREPL